ncbi:MAG TPA: response regulator transcription factor [Gemmatimonadales bacterium]|nr:response regulator transcription factor [Gemmatimonadales bacterium]HRX19132.1 response regulator transcription factor [Gemmatimonadales bacterium]
MEDDQALARAVLEGLTDQGWRVDHADRFDSGLARARDGGWDVIALDIQLPGGTGTDLCRRLRADGDTTPIVMLTARDAVADRVTGLDAGADDYLTKPFAFAELVARLRALGRRPPTLVPDALNLGDLHLDFAARRVTRAGAELSLTAKEYALLEVLARRVGQVVSRPAITAAVWDDNHDPFTNVLEVLVRRLRRKIDDGREAPLLETVRGAGYRLRR